MKTFMSIVKKVETEKSDTTGIRKYFIVDNVDEVAQYIKSNYSSLQEMRVSTFDFSDMYTNLPHTKIKAVINTLVEEYIGDNLIVRDKRSRIGKDFYLANEFNEDVQVAYNIEEIKELLNVILSNSYIKNGDHMLRQCHGIPMGSQCSPHIANLYCFGIEKNWIDNIIHSNGLSIANDRIIFRYIDDFLIFSKNEPTPPPQAEYQMSYTDTSLGRNDIVFLGMRVRFEERPRGHPFIRLSIWDKENLFNFQPIKYTSSTSNAPRSLGPGILKGALYRAATNINNDFDLYLEIEKVIYRLRSRGYSKKSLFPQYKDFILSTYWDFPKQRDNLQQFFFKTNWRYDKELPVTSEKKTIQQYYKLNGRDDIYNMLLDKNVGYAKLKKCNNTMVTAFRIASHSITNNPDQCLICSTAINKNTETQIDALDIKYRNGIFKVTKFCKDFDKILPVPISILSYDQGKTTREIINKHVNHECHMVVGRTNGGYYFPITSKYTESDIQKIFLKVDTPGKSAEVTTEGKSTPNTPDTDVVMTDNTTETQEDETEKSQTEKPVMKNDRGPEWDISIDKRFPISMHTKPAEGLNSGECGWATINFMADYLNIERIQISKVFKIQDELATQEMKWLGLVEMFQFNPDGWFHQLVIYETIKIHLSLEIHHCTSAEDLDKVNNILKEQNLKRFPFVIITRRLAYTHYILFIGKDTEYAGYDIIQHTPSYETWNDIARIYPLETFDYHFAFCPTKNNPMEKLQFPNLDYPTMEPHMENKQEKDTLSQKTNDNDDTALLYEMLQKFEEDDISTTAKAADPLDLRSSNENTTHKEVLQEPKKVIQEPKEVIQEPKEVIQDPKKVIQDPKEVIQDPKKVIQDPKEVIQDPKEVIQDPKKVIQDPKEVIQDPKEVIQDPKEVIQDPKEVIQDPKEVIQDPKEVIQDPKKVIQDPKEVIQDPKEVIQDPKEVIQDPKEVIQDPKKVIQDPKKVIQDPKEVIQDPKEVIQNPEIDTHLDPKIGQQDVDLDDKEAIGVANKASKPNTHFDITDYITSEDQKSNDFVSGTTKLTKVPNHILNTNQNTNLCHMEYATPNTDVHMESPMTTILNWSTL